MQSRPATAAHALATLAHVTHALALAPLLNKQQTSKKVLRGLYRLTVRPSFFLVGPSAPRPYCHRLASFRPTNRVFSAIDSRPYRHRLTSFLSSTLVLIAIGSRPFECFDEQKDDVAGK